MSDTGRVVFVGAGPGAADLITVRGAQRLAQADIVLVPAGAVCSEFVHEHVNPSAELINSSAFGFEQSVALYRRAAAQRAIMVVLRPGELSLWTDLSLHLDACRRLGMRAECVPGVSVFASAAAEAGTELAGTHAAEPVILSRGPASTAQQQLAELARQGGTLALSASAARTSDVVTELRTGGYTDDTPVVVAYKPSWPDQQVLHTTLGKLERTVKQHRLWRNTIFLIGKALVGIKPFATNGTRNGTAGGANGRGSSRPYQTNGAYRGAGNAVSNGVSSARNGAAGTYQRRKAVPKSSPKSTSRRSPAVATGRDGA